MYLLLRIPEAAIAKRIENQIQNFGLMESPVNSRQVVIVKQGQSHCPFCQHRCSVT